MRRLRNPITWFGLALLAGGANAAGMPQENAPTAQGAGQNAAQQQQQQQQQQQAAPDVTCIADPPGAAAQGDPGKQAEQKADRPSVAKDVGAAAGGTAGQIAGAAVGGPIGAAAVGVVGERVGRAIGSVVKGGKKKQGEKAAADGSTVKCIAEAPAAPQPER